MEAFRVSAGVVALSEIGDKTQLLALVLAARLIAAARLVSVRKRPVIAFASRAVSALNSVGHAVILASHGPLSAFVYANNMRRRRRVS